MSRANSPSNGTDKPNMFRERRNVIGALIMRELHTRFGRENLGYLWIFAEPILLAAAVALLHSNYTLPISGGVQPVPFALGGYILFIMFRSILSRAETMLEANRPLLYHKPVTLFDMLFARSILELASTAAVLFLLLHIAYMMDLSLPIHDPLPIMGALLLMGWFCLACSAIIMSLSHEFPFMGRLIHPLLYLSLPISGAFYLLDWLPSAWKESASWIPTVHIFEWLREGQFASFQSSGLDIGYVIACCMILSLLGSAMLLYVRPKVELA